MLEEIGVAVRIELIKTSGDKHQRGPLADKGGKGLFVKELESALLSGTIDLAVHSLKDVPTTLTPEFELAAFLPRADPRDCLIANGKEANLESLAEGTLVGSCSPRRISQLLHSNPRVKIVDLRGNVETRLAKVRDGSLGATLLAKAGLDRLEISEPSLIHLLPIEKMLPAAGQGIVAIETLSKSAEVLSILSQLDTPSSRHAAEAERAVVRHLEGNCTSPIAAHARITDSRISLSACVGDPEGNALLADSEEGAVEDRLDLASSLALRLLDRGAAKLIHGAGGSPK
jgi:hydroxymethylbilane synthase